MTIFRAPINTITDKDIAQLCTDAVSEGLELELKSDLPSRSGQRDGWHAGQAFGDYARNAPIGQIPCLVSMNLLGACAKRFMT